MTTPIRFNKASLAMHRRAALAARARPASPEPGMAPGDALETLRGAPTAIRTFLDGHRAALAAAHQAAATDPNLSEDGRAARHAELRQQAEQAATARAGELRQSVGRAAAALAARAESAMPAPASGVEAMMGRQVAWNRVREMLDGGVPLDEVIGDTTDPETLHAMRDELPAYLRVHGFAQPARADVLRTLDDQLAHAAGGKTLDAHLAAREAEDHVARLRPLLDHVDQVAAGKAPVGGGMVAVVRAEHAARQMSAAGPAGDAA